MICIETSSDKQYTRFKIDTMFKTVTYTPISGPFFADPTIEEQWNKCTLTVLVQGKLAENLAHKQEKMDNELVFLTVHDIGSNAETFVDFVNSDQMTPIRQRATFLHICVPGQETDAKDFLGAYPSMDQIAGMLPKVLDHFMVDKCIAIGEGAGADIVCRFAIEFTDWVAGMVLIHCPSPPHGIIENLQEIFADFRLHDGQMNNSAWNYLLTHKFGDHEHELKEHFMKEVRAKLNEHNLSRFLFSFHNRFDFSETLKERMANVDTIMVTGAKSPYHKSVLYENIGKVAREKTFLLLADNASDVLREAPEHVVTALNLLCDKCPLKMANSAERAMAAGSNLIQLSNSNSHPQSNGATNDLPTLPSAGCILKQTNGLLELPAVMSGGSSRSSLQCKHCGKDCCWCTDEVAS